MTGEQISALVFALIMIGVVASGLFGRGLRGGQVVRYVLIWGGIFGLAYIAFLFRDDFGTLMERARADIGGPSTSMATGNALIVRQRDGHFWVDGATASGETLLMIDSGATVTMLSREAAQRLGVKGEGGFPVMVETANGRMTAERGRIERLTVGGIIVDNLPILISDSGGDVSVLGMNWLNRMARWRVERGELIIEPHTAARSP